jgi:hypothetical protein
MLMSHPDASSNVRTWWWSPANLFYVPVGCVTGGYAALVSNDLAVRLICMLIVMATATYGTLCLRTRIEIDERTIGRRSDLRAWRTPFSDIARVDKSPLNLATDVTIVTRDGRRLRFGLTAFRDNRSLAQELLARTPHDLITPRATRLLSAVASGRRFP